MLYAYSLDWSHHFVRKFYGRYIDIVRYTIFFLPSRVLTDGFHTYCEAIINYRNVCGVSVSPITTKSSQRMWPVNREADSSMAPDPTFDICMSLCLRLLGSCFVFFVRTFDLVPHCMQSMYNINRQYQLLLSFAILVLYIFSLLA